MPSLSLLTIIYSFVVMTNANPQLNVVFTDIEEEQGSIRFAVFNNAQDFKDGKEGMLELRFSIEEAKQNDFVYLLQDLPAGTYAIAAYHDLNDNGELDTGLFGIPNEPYGFSNDPKAKWRAPKYKEINFDLAADKPMELQVSLRRWRKR